MAKQIKFKWNYYNPNPYYVKGKKHIQGDCVIRAICKAAGLDWFSVYDMLCAKGREIGSFGNHRTVYPSAIEELGFSSVSVKREKGKKALNVETFCDEHPTGTYILRLASHLTSVVDGVCYDTWYPQKQTIYKYWKKED